MNETLTTCPKSLPELTTPVPTLSVKDLNDRYASDIATGVKQDAEKIRVELLEPSWLEEVGRVLTFGANKYTDNNWRGGMPYTRLLGALLRHTFAIMRGEDYDPESGLTHVGHASCCLMFLFWMMRNRPDLDNRWNGR